jgi:hypothetical protein
MIGNLIYDVRENEVCLELDNMVLGHPNLKFILAMENFSNKQILVFPAPLDSVYLCNPLGHYALPSLPNFRL